MDLILKNISKAYGGKQVLSHFSHTFPEGSVTAVMAPSGAGKTTLLRLILALEKPDSGSITGIPPRKAALFQEDRLCPNLSVLANIRSVTGRAAPEKKILSLLEQLGLAESASLPACQLSGGMARRAALARALLYESELLILDEPFNGLDEANRRLAAKAILANRKGRTLIFVTHRPEDPELLQADTLLEL